MKSRFPVPHAVFVLDVDPALSTYRISHSRGEEPNHFEERGNLAKAREIFNGLCTPEMVSVDGSMSREAVHKAIVKKLIDGALTKVRCATKSYGCDDPMYCSFRLAATCGWLKTAKALNANLEHRISDKAYT